MPETFATPAEAADGYARWVHRTGLAETTATTYARWVADFLGWVDEHGAAYADALRDPDVRDYAARDWRRMLLTGRELAPRSVALAMAAIGSFYDWLGLGRPPGVGVDLPDSNREGLGDEANLRAFLRAAKRAGHRDYAMVTLMALAGPRAAEVAALNVDDVAITDRTGRVQVRYGKGGKPRTLEVGPQIRDALRAWLADRATWPAAASSRALFLARGGERLSVRSIQDRVARIGEDAGVGRVSPHKLRHTFGRRWMESGGDVVALQRQMGHRALSTTALYAKPSQRYLEEQAARMDVEL